MRLSRAWVKHDASGGTRGKLDGDCTVRALATARDLPYDQAWHLLYTVQGETRTTGFRLPEWLKARPGHFGVVEMLSFPAVKGRPRLTGETFCQAYPHGRYILNMAHHVAAVIDGKLYDTWNSSSKCVYSAWEIRPAPSDEGQAQ